MVKTFRSHQQLISTAHTIEDWKSLDAIFGEMTDTGWIFRGCKNIEFPLTPSIGRLAVHGAYHEEGEKRLFNAFKKRAMALKPDFGESNWFWLAFAQHNGVPTRLLDWTTSPLVGLFFALAPEEESDRAVYCLQYSEYINEVSEPDPFECRNEGRFTPPLFIERIRSQRAVFTIHPQPTTEFLHGRIEVLKIPRASVEKMRKQLFKYGIDYWSVYPDAEGLALQMRWQWKNRIGFGRLDWSS